MLQQERPPAKPPHRDPRFWVAVVAAAAAVAKVIVEVVKIAVG